MTSDVEWIGGFHDCYVHGTRHLPDRGEWRLDLDHMTQWVQPAEGEQYYSFWMAPATVVFHDVRELRIALEPPDGEDRFILQNVSRQPAAEPGMFAYEIETLGGTFELVSSGFTRHLRAEPVHVRKQRFTLEERGGVSFAIPDGELRRG